MSQFYDQASLVVVPSGYKAGTVYAQKPLTTDGQLAFTRTGDTATRVNSAGLIEKVRTNLCLQSNTFSNAAWNKIAQGTGTTPVVTANYTTDPFGGNNGWRLQCNLGGGTTTSDRSWLQQDIAGTTVPTTVSVYAKLNSAGSATFALTNASTDNVTITSTDWVRISTVRTAATTVYSFRIGLIGGVGQSGTLDISIAFAQLETGDIATNYIPTTTAAVSVGPVNNVPRLDYLGSTCPRLLLEPQRTNLYTYSEQLNQWTASSATVTANYAVSPDGYTNAERVQFSAGGLLYNGGTGSAGQNTLSVYAKATNGTSAKFRFFGNGNTTNSSDQTATGQWQRFTFTYTYSALTAGLKVATTGADDILFYGFQHEIGAYATSYIPTLAASATRGKDNCIKTSASALIGQTEGTVFVEFQINGQSLSEDLYSNNKNVTGGISIQIGTNDRVQGVVLYAGTYIEMLSAVGAVPKGQTNKVAIAYKSGASALYVNGVQVATSATAFAFTSTLSEIDIANDSAYFAHLNNKVISQVLQFKTRLTNAELAELTTL